MSYLMPQGSVAWSSCASMTSAVFSLSDRISWSVLVPRMVLRVVEASSRVDWLAFVTLQTEAMGLEI